MTRTAILTAEHIHLEFGGVKAANDANLVLYQGELAAIIGPNGSGKSTFLNICTGYVPAQSGCVRFHGQEITRLKPRRITRLGIARSFQLPQLFSEQTVVENLLVALASRHGFWNLKSLYQRAWLTEVHELLDMFGLDRYAQTLISDLPEGIRKLIDIAASMALRPSLLLMDEPTSGVSSQEKFLIMDTLVPVLRQQGITALIVEHDMELVEKYMDRVLVWNAGQVSADGTPDDILKREDVIKNVVGVM